MRNYLPLTERDLSTILAHLWDVMSIANEKLNSLDSVDLDQDDRDEVSRCKTVLGGYTLGILEMADHPEESEPLAPFVRDVIEEFCWNVGTFARALTNQGSRVVRI